MPDAAVREAASPRVLSGTGEGGIAWSMTIAYDTIVPWGRSLDEYVAMFALSASDLGQPILGCGDGPAAFNGAMRKRGGRVVSVDPLYALPAATIRRRIDETCDSVIEQTRRHREQFVWKTIRDVAALKALRLAAMNDFLEDFETGKREGRYVAGGVPHLPFADKAFALCVASHFLFLYTANLSLDFHLAAIDAMLRVAREVRLFPLLAVDGRRSPYVDVVRRHYADADCAVDEVPVDYEFQIGGRAMLRLRG